MFLLGEIMIRNKFFISLLFLSFFGGTLSATSKTLPQGVLSFGATQTALEFSQIAVQEGDDFKFVTSEEFKVKHIPKLVQVIDTFSLPESTKEIRVAESYKLSPIDMNLAYGITDSLTLSLSASYINKELKYTQAYIDFMTALNGVNDALINIPPSTAKANGLGDMTLGLKYSILDNVAFGLSYRGGFLNIGVGPRDRVIEDGIEQLQTGDDADYVTAALFCDFPVFGVQTLDFMVGYEYSTDGYERALDNDYKTNRGDKLIVTADTAFSISDNISLSPQIMYVSTGEDTKYTSGTWSTIQDSKSDSLIGQILISYKPFVFLKMDVGYQKVFSQKVAKGNYDFPGRLFIDDLFKFGLTIYYK